MTVQGRLPDDVIRRIARLERYGFTAEQARALALADHDVVRFVSLESLVGAA